MAPIKKSTNEENNCDVIEFDYGDPSVSFNWICVACKQKSQSDCWCDCLFYCDCQSDC